MQLTGSRLLFMPTTAILRYINRQITSSACLHLEDTQCGIRGLNNRKSPGLNGIATPNVGKQKYMTVGLLVEYWCIPFKCTL